MLLVEMLETLSAFRVQRAREMPARGGLVPNSRRSPTHVPTHSPFSPEMRDSLAIDDG